MAIGTSVYLIIPRAKSAANYDQIIESLGGEEAIRSSWDEADSDDIFTSQKSKPTSYKDTTEYKNKEAEISFMVNRYQALQSGNLLRSLDNLLGNFFNSFTQYQKNPSPANIALLQNYASAECLEKIQNDTVNKGDYLINYMRYSDLDKETILAYVEMRFEAGQFFVSFIKNPDGNWVVDNYEKN